ncbi:MAG: GTP 3',8-cyclase MoaA [Anaerolinea sp.]|nr:GTP 3',8-cyclase MoaA [Anaerolinea sp.]
MLIDAFARKITYLRISVTDRCNERCAYCLPINGVTWLDEKDLITANEIVRLAEAAIGLGITKIRLTGGEPLVRPDILEIISKISIIPGLKDLSLTTNGMLLGKMAKSLVKAGLQRVNISLDTLDSEKYKKITRFGNFQQTWQGILEAEDVGLFPIKINTVVVGGFNDDEIIPIAKLSITHPWHIRFIELMPVANQEDWGAGLPSVEERYFSSQKMHKILSSLNLEELDSSANSGPECTYQIPGGTGTVGFISPLGDHFCMKCNRLRLTADGCLKSCLLVDKEISIRDALRSGADLTSFLQNAVANKPIGHELVTHSCSDKRCMSQIGG